MEIWGNQVFSYVWDNFTSAYNKGAAVVSDFAKTTTEPIVKSVQWIWEALQGDFNDNRTAGQIAADAALGVIPLVIPPKRAASKSRINTSPAFSAGRVSLLKPSYAFALE